jgi:hypothetical protein
MGNPRHLWSGDWELDSSAAREELAKRRAQNDEPAVTRPEASSPRAHASSPRARPSTAARAAAWLRGLPRRVAERERVAARAPWGWQLKVALLIAVAILATAGAAYGVTTLLADSGAQGSATVNRAHAWLGVDVVGSPMGIMVANVVPGSPAQKAGLQPGDLLNRIDNQPVGTVDGVSAALSLLHPGDRISMQFSRGLASYTTQATLTARPPRAP